MDGEKFRKIIQSGTDEYGSEIWFFLRELAQNSRDADAKQIRVSTGYLNNDIEFIRFEDNGIGMSKSHANDYLFKLFASSKEDQGDSIGKYGIGFWTILKFEPYKIIIESKFKKERWAVQLNTKLEKEPIPATIKNTGTIVTLLRIGKLDKPQNYITTVKTALSKYCKYLTKKKSFEPLPVFFNNELINKKMDLPGILSRKINNKDLIGLVGLAKEPKVMLYAKGLPVWTGSVLGDLTDHTKNTKAEFENGKGLAPVFLINSSNLDINFSRNIPIDNENLTKMISIAENELSNLIFSFIRSTTPWSFIYSLKEGIKKTYTMFQRSLFLKLFLLLIFLIPLEIYLLNFFFSKNNGSKTNYSSVPSDTISQNHRNSSINANNIYAGASVHDSQLSDNISIQYRPKIDGLFKIYPAERYELGRGFVYANSRPLNSEIQLQKTYGISFQIEGVKKGSSFLISKNNYHIDQSSIRINDKIIQDEAFDQFNNYTIKLNLKDKTNSIRYRIYPIKSQIILSKENQKEYIVVPKELKLPNRIIIRLRSIQSLSVPDKVKSIETLTRELIRYDDSKSIVEKYKLKSDTDWLGKVLNIQAGDCDVINGVNALLLRYVDIPARLIIGYVGKSGKINPSLHAWTEYYDRGWKTIDVSTIIQDSRNYKPNTNKLGKKKPFLSKNRTDDEMKENGLIKIIIIVSGLLSLIFIFIYILKHRKFKNDKIDAERMAENLSEIAINALIYPEIWKLNNLWNYKFIPTIGSKYISLDNILIKAKENLLFKSSRDNYLLNSKNIKKLYILDSNDKHYSHLIMAIPSIIDLDEIGKMKIKNLQQADIRIPELKILLQKTEKLLDKGTKGYLKILISTNINNQCFMNIKLSKFIKPFSDQIVLINPDSSILNQFLSTYSENYEYSVFKFIEEILDNFDIQQSEIILIRKRVSKLLLWETL